MEINEFTNINSLPEYVYYGNFERTDEIDKRIFDRIRSEVSYQPKFDIRGANTRQSIFPIVPPIQSTPNNLKVSIQKNIPHDPTKVFSPIQTIGKPIEPFFERINVESSLRNQFFALQHGAEQGVYIPSSNSDLYVVSVPKNNNLREENPFMYLYNTKKDGETYKTTMNTNLINSIGKNVFNNATKQQMRGL